jgi:calmodulin
MTSSVKEEASDRDIRQAFIVFDQDNNGVISSNKLWFVMDIIRERLSYEQLNAVMKEADFDGDGAVTYTHFTSCSDIFIRPDNS